MSLITILKRSIQAWKPGCGWEFHEAWSLDLAGKKTTVKPGAKLAARKRASARSVRSKSVRSKSARSKSVQPKSVQRLDKRSRAPDAARTENARLATELRTALARQTATSDILRVISGSPTDVQPVFDAIVLTAARLLRCERSIILRCDGATFASAAAASPQGRLPILDPDPVPIDPDANFPSRAIVTRKNLHLPDWSLIELPEYERLMQEMFGYNSALYLPLLREDECIGLLVMAGSQPNIFGESEIALAESFRDQALIAIENARLFNETKAALARQTATSDILRVISGSPTDVQPVFDAIVLTAARLLRCDRAFIQRCDSTTFWTVAAAGSQGPLPIMQSTKAPIDPDANFPSRAIVAKQSLHLSDWSAIELPEFERRIRETHGINSALYMPLLRERECIGLLAFIGKQANMFGESEIALAESFRDQALIAIENTRLFNETREALERQTATADILKVIASSPSDVQPVFEAIAERSKRLVDALSTTVFRLEDGVMHLRAFTTTNPEADATLNTMFPAPLSDFSWGEAISNGGIHRVVDTEREIAGMRELARQRGYRSMLFVPLLRDGTPIGVIAVTRVEPGPFVEHHVQLLQTFADQAVIAIENVRLFDEVQARTRDLEESLQQQTATADVLKVISASPGELEPVFQALLANAVHLCEAEFGMLFLFEENEFRAVGKWNLPPAYSEFLGKNTIGFDPRTPVGRAAITKQPVQVADILVDQSYIVRHPGIVAVAEGGGARTLLQVPMLKDNELVGTIGIYRQEIRPFTDKQVALVQNFAAQAVIAIENARLLNELRQRTSDLTQSLDDLRTAQDRLVQTEKLASLGQLTAGIAHEIKNPLNFVNNFSALSVELVDELNDALKPAALNDTTRKEVDDLTQTLKDNLEKVVQHGKRADSIVKNMLLHSREGSGEHRSTDINALLDESLNLAYHGARAEKREFNVTLQRDFDATAGTVEVFPQEITRVFLNLISNGFYAVTKRKAENGGSDFEPAVTAATRNLGSSVEIRIRDNGTGIPAEVKEKMFNPFFTTKPAGEGTGLGLSMSHDIVVKQHGGSIDVETEPGQFTEFRIVLPRTSIIPEKRG